MCSVLTSDNEIQTSVAKYVNAEYKSTHIMAHSRWKTNEGVDFSIWDFAGQAHYYSHHQQFLVADQAVYLVVFKAAVLHEGKWWVAEESDVLSRLEKWICFIASRFPKEAFSLPSRSRIVLVASHGDCLDASGKNTLKTRCSRLPSKLKKRKTSWLVELVEEKVEVVDYTAEESVRHLRATIIGLAQSQLSSSEVLYLSACIDLLEWFHSSSQSDKPSAMSNVMENIWEVVKYGWIYYALRPSKPKKEE